MSRALVYLGLALWVLSGAVAFTVLLDMHQVIHAVRRSVEADGSNAAKRARPTPALNSSGAMV